MERARGIVKFFNGQRCKESVESYEQEEQEGP